MEQHATLPELLEKEELTKKGTIGGKTPVEIIREMNPGARIPTGEEMAEFLKKMTGNQP